MAVASDGSGRNRPGSFAGQPLAWDANGNLVRKGPDHFAWDYRNRLTRVTRDGVGEVARYEYDAFNRLTKRVVAGEAEEWTWAGWQLLERYADGALAMRRIYGQGLDEVVRQEADADGDGLLETVTIPVYDSIGNAVAITDASGKAIERYEYTPYGTRTIRVDLTPPAVEQLREAGGKLLLEFSEEILLQRVRDAIASGQLTLRDTTDDAPIAITADQPVRDGNQKGRRLLLTPDADPPPGANHGMLLHIEPGAMVDLFENRPEMAYEKAFVWLAADQSIDDTAPPRVDLVLTKAGELEVGFSEEIDPQIASAAILLDGAPRTWTAMPDGYTLKPASAISATTHSLQIGPALIDKAGLSLAEPFARSITTGGTDQIAYERPDPRVTPTSTLDNLASFQGHITDPATGLVYMRNRWMDPEMGRFITPDPMGYRDGPSEYAIAGNGPSNATDPLGLYESDVHFYAVYYLSRLAGFSSDDATSIAFASQYVDNSTQGTPASFPRGIWNNVAHGKRLEALHFAAPGHLAVEEGNRFARAAVRVASWSGDLARLGISLHTLADSYSHADFNLLWSDDNRRAGSIRPNKGHADASCGGHAPDLPYLNPQKAKRMASELLAELQMAFRRRSHVEPPPVDRTLLDGDLSRAFAVKNPNELIRGGAWRGLIWLRFGDESVDYDETLAPRLEPLNWDSAVRRQVDIIERLTSYSIDAYSILNQ